MISTKIKSWLILPALAIGGILVGLLIPFDQIRDTVASIFDLKSEVEQESEPDDHEDLHVEITESAQRSIGLIVRRANLGSYQGSYEIPAKIRTLPGADAIKMSSRFGGMIKRVHVSEGQSVKAGDPMFELELTGESLSQAQSALLLAIRKNENLNEELQRLAPLVQQGGLANKRSLELRYEQKQILAEIDTRQQELLLHGLSNEQVQGIISKKTLIRRITVRVPENLLAPQLNLQFTKRDNQPYTFIVESITAKPGSMVSAGDSLCVLAFHEVLVVEGHAFERDLEPIKSLLAKKAKVALSVGTLNNVTKVPDCELAYLGNHARSESNTYPFYIYLVNELENGDGSLTAGYLTWRWKPGQLGHVELPKDRFENMIILPRTAVAENGVSNVVFEWHGQVAHDHDEEEDDHEHADEFVPVEVEVVYRDDEMVVINPDGNLKEGTRVAFTCADQLLFTMQTGGGHGHSHDHDH